MQNKTIYLKGKKSNTVLYGNIVFGILGFLFLITFVLIFTPLFSSNIFLAIVVSLFASALIFYLMKHFFKNVIFTEYIVLDTDSITIFYKSIAALSQKKFKLTEIIYFGFAGYTEFTNHTMHSQVLDITGLGTREKQLQNLIDEGTIEIETVNAKHRFGKNMASWDVEELINEIEQITGKKFECKYKIDETDDDSENQSS